MDTSIKFQSLHNGSALPKGCSWFLVVVGLMGFSLQVLPALAQPFIEKSNEVLMDQETGLLWAKGGFLS